MRRFWVGDHDFFLHHLLAIPCARLTKKQAVAGAACSVTHDSRFYLRAVVIALSLLTSAHAEDAKYDLHELSLWGLDPTLEQANELQHYPSAMPGVVDTDRSRANEARRLTPLSIITLHGEPVDDLEVDLRVQAGRFVGHWPPAESKSGRLRWLDLASTIKTDDQALFAAVDDKHWFVQARRLDALYVHDKSRAERFLTYDCELKYDLPVQVTGGPDNYQITNSGKHPLLDLFVIVPEGDGVRVGRLDSLPPSVSKTTTTAQGADKGAVGQGDKERRRQGEEEANPGEPVENKGLGDKETKGQGEEVKPPAAPTANSAPGQAGGADAPAAVERPAIPAAAIPAAAVAKAPAAPAADSLKPTEIVMSPLVSREAGEFKAVAETFNASLLKLGFTQREVELLMERAGNTWLEAKEMVVLFRLPAEAIEERLSLIAYPAPRKTVRAALIVVRNIDPKIRDELKKLIAQLGSAEYNEREDAEKRLTELGRLALPALKAALKSADLEVVFRAERILLAQNEKLEGT